MQVSIRADDGDEVLVRLDELAIEQSVVRLMLENAAFPVASDFDSVALTPARARELGRALLVAANLVESAARLDFDA